MRIYLCGDFDAIGIPHRFVHVFGTVAELENALLLICPDLIVTREILAAELIDLMEAMYLEVPLAVVAESDVPRVVRNWTAQGAAYVWPRANWELSLTRLVQGSQSPARNIDAGDAGQEPYIPDFRGGEVDQPRTVAIGGVYAGAGSTHTALLVAQYLARDGKQVALWEGGSNNCFDYLDYVREGTLHRRKQFLFGHVRVFKASAEWEQVDAIADQFDYLVLDLGSLHTTRHKDLFFRANVPILIGSGSEWRQQEVLQFCRQHSGHRQTRWRIVLPNCPEKQRAEMAEYLAGRPVYSLPTHTDPLLPQTDTEEVLVHLLGVVTGSPNKRASRLWK